MKYRLIWIPIATKSSKSGSNYIHSIQRNWLVGLDCLYLKIQNYVTNKFEPKYTQFLLTVK